MYSVDIASKDKDVRYTIFSRNFGKEAAMLAGLHKAKGDYVVVMDVFSMNSTINGGTQSP